MSVSMFGSHMWELYLSLESYVIWTCTVLVITATSRPILITQMESDFRLRLNTQVRIPALFASVFEDF